MNDSNRSTSHQDPAIGNLSFKTETHSFDIHLAEIYSIQEAILIKHFAYWIGVNRRLRRNFHEGRYWTYQTIEEIAAHFPYWSTDQINRIIRKLVKRKILLKGNFNKLKMDTTLWYAFADESPNGLAKSPNGFGEIAKAIPDTKPDTKPLELPKGNSLVEGEKPPTKVNPISEEAIKEAEYLWSKILTVFPKHKQPSLNTWAAELALMARVDKRSWEDIHKVIDFAFQSSFWMKVIQGPKSIRKSFDRLLAEITPIDNSGSRLMKNRSFAWEVKSQIKNNEKIWKNFNVSDSGVIKLDSNETVSYFLPPDEFECSLLKLFKLKRQA
jgi:hypothetical protein